MTTPSQYEFDTAREVLEFMVAHTEENEPHAVNTIETLNEVLLGNSFDEEDYE